MKRIRRMTAALLSVLAVFLLLPLQALAAGSIDLNQDVSLTISYQDGNTPLVGAEFDIFLVATVDEYGELTTTKDFAQFHVNIRGKDDEAWRTLASTLEGYVLRDDISPADSAKTSAMVHFFRVKDFTVILFDPLFLFDSLSCCRPFRAVCTPDGSPS